MNRISLTNVLDLVSLFEMSSSVSCLQFMQPCPFDDPNEGSRQTLVLLSFSNHALCKPENLVLYHEWSFQPENRVVEVIAVSLLHVLP